MDKHELFSSPLWESVLDIDNDALLVEVKEFVNNTEHSAVSSIGGYQSSKPFISSIFNDAIYNALPKEIKDIPLLSDTAFAWVNINKRGSTNRRHNHGTTAKLSGCYYLSVPQGSGNIRFYDPRGAWVRSLGIKDYVEIEPTEGMLLFFPPWLEHEVEQSSCDEERISIAFNVNSDVPSELEMMMKQMNKIHQEVN